MYIIIYVRDVIMDGHESNFLIKMIRVLLIGFFFILYYYAGIDKFHMNLNKKVL